MSAIRRWPSSIRWRVAISPPATSSTAMLGSDACTASTRMHGSPAALMRSTSRSGGLVETTRSPSARSPRSKSSNARRWRSSDSMSKTMRSYADPLRPSTMPRTRWTADGFVNQGRRAPITIVRWSDRFRATELGR